MAVSVSLQCIIMRIISGKYKSRKIPDTWLRHTRPTTDFARTGLFSMMEHRLNVEGTHALDLFAGTGSIGFELLSRGCERVTMLDSDKRSILHLKKTAEMFEEENAVIIHSEAFRFLKTCQPVYDLVFADPPFDFGYELYEKLIELVMEKSFTQNGLFVLEHQATDKFEEQKYFTESRRFGNVAFSFFAQTK